VDQRLAKQQSKGAVKMMTRVNTIFATLATLGVLGSMLAATASAATGVAPTLLFPLCSRESAECGPTVLVNLDAEGGAKLALAISTEFQSTNAHLRGSKLGLELTLLEERGRLEGIYLAKLYEYVNVANGASCETAGAANAGEIEIGEKGKSERIKIVYIKIGSGAALEVGLLLEIADITELCESGRLEILIKGALLGSIAPLNTEIGAGSNTITGGVVCTATTGVPLKTKYINSSGVATEASLSIKSGGTTAKGCELIGNSETAVVKLLPNKMVELMG
jgi:hypothetical protein